MFFIKEKAEKNDYIPTDSEINVLMAAKNVCTVL